MPLSDAFSFGPNGTRVVSSSKTSEPRIARDETPRRKFANFPCLSISRRVVFCKRAIWNASDCELRDHRNALRIHFAIPTVIKMYPREETSWRSLDERLKVAQLSEKVRKVFAESFIEMSRQATFARQAMNVFVRFSFRASLYTCQPFTMTSGRFWCGNSNCDDIYLCLTSALIIKINKYLFDIKFHLIRMSGD